MDRLLYLAMSGAKNTLMQQAAVSNNLANASTNGFRNEMHNLRAVEVESNTLPTRAFVVDASVANDYTPGPIAFTSRSLDVAIRGKGWLTVQMPDGSEAYTRSGNLEVSANGVLQTPGGLPVLGDGGAITVPTDQQIEIGKDGTLVSIPTSGDRSNISQIGRLKLVNPPEDQLVRGDDSYFHTKDGQPAQQSEEVSVAGGYLEGSNVNVVDEMVTMISLSRQFEMQMQMIKSAEENDRSATRMLSTN